MFNYPGKAYLRLNNYKTFKDIMVEQKSFQVNYRTSQSKFEEFAKIRSEKAWVVVVTDYMHTRLVYTILHALYCTYVRMYTLYRIRYTQRDTSPIQRGGLNHRQ